VYVGRLRLRLTVGRKRSSDHVGSESADLEKSPDVHRSWEVCWWKGGERKFGWRSG